MPQNRVPAFAIPPWACSCGDHMIVRQARPGIGVGMSIPAVLAGLSTQVEQRGHDAPADVFGVAEGELREDVVDVPLDGSLRQEELPGDRRIAAALRDQSENLELTRRELIEVSLLARACGSEQFLDDSGIDVRAPA